jgi:hypothetical protein
MEKCVINNNEFDFILSNDEQNVISINEKIESFSDVFECTLNGQQIILEKVGEVDGNPLIYIDIEYKGKKYVTEAILVNDEEAYIKINESNLHLIKTEGSLIIDNTNEEDEQILIEKVEKGSIQNETTDVMGFLGETLQKYSDDRLKIKLDKYNEIYNEKIDLLELKKNQTLKHLEEEFNKNLRILKDDIQDKLQLFLRETDKENKDNITLQSKELSNQINEKYNGFVTEIKDLKEFTSKNINKFLDIKYKEISKLVESYINNISKKTKLLEKSQNVILENGKNIINEANEELKKIKNNIALIEEEENKIVNKQNNIIQSLLKDNNKKFNQLNKKFKLLSEKKNNEYNELLAAVNNKEVVEYKTILKEKIQDVELTQVKNELIREVTENFSQDIRGLKRYVEMSSGGGTNAVQYANGGVMNGNLRVNNLSAGGQIIGSIDNGNTAAGEFATVIGGEINSASESRTFIGGGSCNNAGGNRSVVVGGCNNDAYGGRSFIGGGTNNRASNNYSIIVGGVSNLGSGNRTFIGGGFENVTCGSYSTIAGGKQNEAAGGFSTVTGGLSSEATGGRSFIGGGTNNRASNNYTTVAGGQNNIASGGSASIVGGKNNLAPGAGSFTGGGIGNQSSKACSSIIGGTGNFIRGNGNCGVIGGGANNLICGSQAFIGAGECNCACAARSGILGGQCNTVTHSDSFIIGSCLASNAVRTTFVNNLSAQGSLHAGNGISFTGDLAGCTVTITNGIITSVV